MFAVTLVLGAAPLAYKCYVTNALSLENVDSDDEIISMIGMMSLSSVLSVQPQVFYWALA